MLTGNTKHSAHWKYKIQNSLEIQNTMLTGNTKYNASLKGLEPRDVFQCVTPGHMIVTYDIYESILGPQSQLSLATCGQWATR